MRLAEKRDSLQKEEFEQRREEAARRFVKKNFFEKQ